MQLTFRQVFVYFLGVVLMAAVTWWFFASNQAAAEREKLLQAQAEKQEKKLGHAFEDAQKETGEIKKLVEALALAHANRKPGEPLPTLKLAPPPPLRRPEGFGKVQAQIDGRPGARNSLDAR